MIHKEILDIVINKPDWIDVLEKIVKKKNLDPENINIKEIVNYYLEYIRNIKDLKIPGNLILAASILLRIKAYHISFEEDDEEENKDVEIKDLKEPLLKIRKRRVTLKDLIETVKDIIKIEEKKKLKSKQNRDDTLDLHVEDMSFDVCFFENLVEEKEDFEVFIGETYEKIKKNMDSEKVVLFSQILDKEDILYVCKSFLALLHLANKGLVVLWQDDHFDEIIIKVIE